MTIMGTRYMLVKEVTSKGIRNRAYVISYGCTRPVGYLHRSTAWVVLTDADTLIYCMS